MMTQVYVSFVTVIVFGRTLNIFFINRIVYAGNNNNIKFTKLLNNNLFVIPYTQIYIK